MKGYEKLQFLTNISLYLGNNYMYNIVTIECEWETVPNFTSDSLTFSMTSSNH